MGRLREFFRLSRSDRWLLGRAWLLIAAIRLGLAILQFSSLLGMLKRFSSRKGDRSPSGSRSSEPEHRSEHHGAVTQRLAWSIRVASRYVPGADTCLVQALAMQALLQRQGFPAKLCLGASRDGTAPLKAHAWVESDGVVVIGGTELDRYTLLSPSAEGSPQEPTRPSKPPS